jgi:hypothetical protein
LGMTWQVAEKIVFSKSLESAPTGGTRIGRDFDPELVRQLKGGRRSRHDGGAGLGGLAIRAGLVGELQLLLVPVIVSGGRERCPVMPARPGAPGHAAGASGAVYLRCRPRPAWSGRAAPFLVRQCTGHATAATIATMPRNPKVTPPKVAQVLRARTLW